MTHSQHALGAGPITPESDEPTGLQAGGFRGQGTTDSADCAAVGTAAEGDKAFATLRAMLAMRGYELHIVSGGDGGAAYYVNRWNVSRALADLAAIESFVDLVGARA